MLSKLRRCAIREKSNRKVDGKRIGQRSRRSQVGKNRKNAAISFSKPARFSWGGGKRTGKFDYRERKQSENLRISLQNAVLFKEKGENEETQK